MTINQWVPAAHKGDAIGDSARRMRGLSDQVEVTPMLRLIHNRYFVELGVSNSRQARMNFMYIF